MNSSFFRKHTFSWTGRDEKSSTSPATTTPACGAPRLSLPDTPTARHAQRKSAWDAGSDDRKTEYDDLVYKVLKTGILMPVPPAVAPPSPDIADVLSKAIDRVWDRSIHEHQAAAYRRTTLDALEKDPPMVYTSKDMADRQRTTRADILAAAHGSIMLAMLPEDFSNADATAFNEGLLTALQIIEDLQAFSPDRGA